MCILHNTHTYIVTIVLEDLCDNIGLVGVSAKWSYVTASPSHLDQAIPILSPLLFMHVGHPYIPLFKIRRIFDLLVNPRRACARVTVLGLCVCLCVCPAPRVLPLCVMERPVPTASAQSGKHFKYGVFSKNALVKNYGVKKPTS